MSGQLDALDMKLKALETRLMAWHKQDPVSQRLATQPAIGPAWLMLGSAASLALKVSDPQGFRAGRHLAAWLGLTPRENSTGGQHPSGPDQPAG